MFFWPPWTTHRPEDAREYIFFFWLQKNVFWLTWTPHRPDGTCGHRKTFFLTTKKVFFDQREHTSAKGHPWTHNWLWSLRQSESKGPAGRSSFWHQYVHQPGQADSVDIRKRFVWLNKQVFVDHHGRRTDQRTPGNTEKEFCWLQKMFFLTNMDTS